MNPILFASLLFLIGLLGLITRRQLVSLLLSLEILCATQVLFVYGASLHGVEGYIISLCILGISAAELAVGVSIWIALQKGSEHSEPAKLQELKN